MDDYGLDSFLGGASSAYVIVSATAATEPSFPPRGYAGPSGRLDVVARAMVAPLHAEPSAVALGVLLGPPRPPVTVAGTRGCLGGRERSAMHAIRRALAGEPPSGCWAGRVGVDYVMHKLAKNGFRIVLLKEDGEDLAGLWEALHGRRAYVAGSHVDIPEDQERLIMRYAEFKVSLGPVSLLTSHALAYVAWARVVAEACRGGGPG